MKPYIPLLLAVSALFLFACSGKTPEPLGVHDGKLSACPASANCVSSQAKDPEQRVEPIAARGNPDVVMVDLANAIESMFGGKVVAMDGPYLRAEFTSRVLRFVDDLECYYDEGKGVIDVRSASRIGQMDFDANRNRVEELRKVFTSRRGN
ncbi:MAG: DUF1499 domain-containing protein [Pseudomonadota bacterium]